MEVKRLAPEHVLKISSGQVIVSLASATKELIENSLDAGASTIEITIGNHGVDFVEVSDNGKGIPSEHYGDVARRYTTSKLVEVEDLHRITSYGFRGEGLNSLSSVSKLSIVTRTSNDPIANSLTFDEKGELLSQSPVAGGVGTSIKIGELFHSLPVRRNELIKNSKREYSKLLAIVQAYAIICFKTSFTVSHVDKKGERAKVLYTGGKGELTHSLNDIFGKRFLTTLRKFSAKLHDQRDVSVAGYVSINDSKACKTNASQQFTFLNGRPVDLPKLSRVINEVYRTVNPVVLRQQSFPVFILDITIPPDMVDINMAPDKRTVLFVDQDSIFNMLKSLLCRELDPEGERSFELQILPPVQPSPAAPSASQSQFKTPKKDVPFPDKLGSPESDSMDLDDVQTQSSPAKPSTSPVLIPSPPQHSQPIHEHFEQPLQVVINSSQQSNSEDIVLDSFQPPFKKPMTQELPQSEDIDIEISFPQPEPKKNSIDAILEVYSQKPAEKTTKGPSVSRSSMLERMKMFAADSDATISDIHRVFGSKPAQVSKPEIETIPDSPPPAAAQPTHEEPAATLNHRHSCHHGCDHDHMPINEPSSQNLEEFDLPSNLGFSAAYIVETATPTLSFNMSSFSSKYKSREARIGRAAEQKREIHAKFKKLKPDQFQEGPQKIGSKQFRRFSAISANSERVAREEMTKQVSKSDFARMVIVGQFNKAFIIAKLDEELFILDQHACDEKFNFEELCKQQKISIQPLVVPLPLELSPPDVEIVLENMQEFVQRGFRIELAPDSEHALQRLRLVGCVLKKSSVSADTQIQELIEVLRTGGDLGIIPSEYKANATEACRKSIMFGEALRTHKMQEVVNHMATMNRPWNCPHGRPTMRHLMSLYHHK